MSEKDKIDSKTILTALMELPNKLNGKNDSFHESITPLWPKKAQFQAQVTTTSEYKQNEATTCTIYDIIRSVSIQDK